MSQISTQSADIQIARLEMMLEISRSLNSTHDLSELLQSITNVATRLTDTEAASILLIDKRTHDLYFEAATGEKRAEIERIAVPMEGSIAGWIATNGEPLVINNIIHDSRHYREIDQQLNFQTRSILGVPLRTQNEVIGVLEVINKRHLATFSGDDLYILNTLASQAAVAINNARLFAQSDQIADMVHELRSPLASIMGFSELLLIREDMAPKDIRAGLQSIHREAGRLAVFINDFLDLTRLETGRTILQKQIIKLDTLSEQVLNTFHPQALEHQITLSLDSQADIPLVSGDQTRIRQVLVNLIDNAIKYSDTGGQVQIKIFSNDVRVQVSVSDTGSGIAPDELEAVFDKFYRLDRHARTTRGSGLGLPIAKKIIEAHEGDIWVESEVGIGSKFNFSLPIHPN